MSGSSSPQFGVSSMPGRPGISYVLVPRPKDKADPYPKALRPHVGRFLDPKTILCIVFELFWALGFMILKWPFGPKNVWTFSQSLQNFRARNYRPEERRRTSAVHQDKAPARTPLGLSAWALKHSRWRPLPEELWTQAAGFASELLGACVAVHRAATICRWLCPGGPTLLRPKLK